MAKILVIEDDSDIRFYVLKVLEFEEFEILEAENGLIGVALAKEHLPDLIICDILMPELSGYGVSSQIRSDPVTMHIPFIFLTAQRAKEDVRKGMNLGADDFLTKPIKAEELRQAIYARLERQAAFSEQASKQIDALRLNLSYVLPHEVRTPLTIIMGYCQLLTAFGPDSLPEPTEVLEMVKDMYSSAFRLHRMIENYLLYANLKFLEYDPKQKALWQQQEPEISQMKEIIEICIMRKSEEFGRESDITPKLVSVNLPIPSMHVEKMVEELLDNALKFSEKGTPVSVTTTIQDKQVQLTISDQGRGMTREQIASIGAYMQFDRKEYEQQGSGLGLILAKMLADLYRARFSVDSIPEHHTTVTVTFTENVI